MGLRKVTGSISVWGWAQKSHAPIEDVHSCKSITHQSVISPWQGGDIHTPLHHIPSNLIQAEHQIRPIDMWLQCPQCKIDSPLKCATSHLLLSYPDIVRWFHSRKLLICFEAFWCCYWDTATLNLFGHCYCFVWVEVPPLTPCDFPSSTPRGALLLFVPTANNLPAVVPSAAGPF